MPGLLWAVSDAIQWEECYRSIHCTVAYTDGGKCRKAKTNYFYIKKHSQKQLKMSLSYNLIEEGAVYTKGGEQVLVLNKHQVSMTDGIEYRYVYKLVGQDITHYSVPYPGNELNQLQQLVGNVSAEAA